MSMMTSLANSIIWHRGSPLGPSDLRHAAKTMANMMTPRYWACAAALTVFLGTRLRPIFKIDSTV